MIVVLQIHQRKWINCLTFLLKQIGCDKTEDGILKVDLIETLNKMEAVSIYETCHHIIV